MVALLLAAPVAAPAAEPQRAYPRASVQTDVLLFALRGYSVWVGLAAAPHVNVAIGSFAGDAIGQPEGWDARTRFGPFVIVSYFLRPDHRGFYGGMGLGMLQWRVSRDDDPTAGGEFDQVVAAPVLGYRWFPFDTQGLYVDPFASVAIPIFQDDEPRDYDQPFVSLLVPGVNVGWQF